MKPRAVVATLACLAGVLVLLSACAAPRAYTSLDLELLPCEQGDAPVFFFPLEFDAEGKVAFGAQRTTLLDRVRGHPPVTDIVVFLHGWNKNPSSAEADYQNFLCRLHARLRATPGISETKRRGGLLVAGIFWPSTITGRPRDPLVLEVPSYYRIRERVDVVAAHGLEPLLGALQAALAQAHPPEAVRLHLVGHSFGGRMLVRTLERMQVHGTLVPFLQSLGTVNVVLINAAIGPSQFDWLQRAIAQAKGSGKPGRFTEETDAYLYNVHSFQDDANRALYPLASLFDDDESACGAGACGVRAYATICVADTGERILPPSAARARSILTWNVDATPIVFGHSDIYKGRVARLVVDLLYDAEGRKRYPDSSADLPDTANRCAAPQ